MNAETPTMPPQWPLKLLKRVIKSDYLEELEGDIHEVFLDDLESMSSARAGRKYIWECLRLLRQNLVGTPRILQKLNTYTMIKTNFKIAFRILRKGKTYTAINLLGLASSLAIALLIIQYVRFELSYESYNPNADELIRVTMDYLDGDVVFEQDCETYPPLGPKIKNEFPQVKAFTRAYHIDELTLKVGDSYFRESKMYGADPAFFELFHYPFLQGNQEEAFLAPWEVVLTQSQARKMFGTEDVVGKTMEITSDDFTLEVVGLIADPPANTHLKFNMLLSYETLKDVYEETDDNWDGNNTFTYLQLSDKTQYGSFLSRLDQLNQELREQDLLSSEKVLAQPMKDIHLYSNKSFEAEPNGNADTVYFMLGVSLLIILIALFNYINLATSQALDRAREVGIRKIHGSTRAQLISQFYMESILMFAASGALAIGLITLFLNYFRNLAQLPGDWNPLVENQYWLLFAVIILICTFVSGSIPAVVLSSFKPSDVLKGKYAHSIAGNRLRQALVVLQFGITVFLLVQTLTASQQLNYMRNKDLGLKGENVMVIYTPDQNWTAENYEAFKGEVLNQAPFVNVALSDAVPGMPAHVMGTSMGVNPVDAVEKHNNNMYIYQIDHEFLSVLGMELAAGENFVKGENAGKLIVNEEALRVWGIPEAELAIGKQVGFWGERRTIIGVMEDFHQFSPKDPLIPMIFAPTQDGAWLMSIQTSNGSPLAQAAQLEEVYKRHFPDNPFNFFWLDQEFDKQYQSDVQFQQVFAVLTVLAVMIACLGLFGLASFTITKRSKEIGIRKVLGASIQSVIFLVSSQFMKLVMVSLLLALPLTFWIVRQWLEDFTYQVVLSPWLFLAPALLIVAVAFLSIFSKTYRVSVTNPVKSLRDE